MIRKFANMLYLQNYVVYSFNLSRVLIAQRILRFYEKTAVTLLPNYLGIGFWSYGSTYNYQQNILSESYVSKLKIGDCLNNSLIN